jgi:hypothetical protein
MKRAHLAAIALICALTGCQSETESFNTAASEKVAAEKGLRPGGPPAKASGKTVNGRRSTSKTDFDPMPKP